MVRHHFGREIGENRLKARIADVEFVELCLRIEVCSASAAMFPKTVDDSRLVARGDKGVDEVRADEASAAGDEDAHAIPKRRAAAWWRPEVKREWRRQP